MGQLLDTSVIQTSPIRIDPRLPVPDGVVGVTSVSEENQISNDPGQLTTTPDGFDIIDSDIADRVGTDEQAGADDTTTLPAPQTITVVSQTVRVISDRRSVVDVVLDVEDVPGSIKYEIRVSK